MYPIQSPVIDIQKADSSVKTLMMNRLNEGINPVNVNSSYAFSKDQTTGLALNPLLQPEFDLKRGTQYHQQARLMPFESDYYKLMAKPPIVANEQIGQFHNVSNRTSGIQNSGIFKANTVRYQARLD
jgi:hypothetical protein